MVYATYELNREGRELVNGEVEFLPDLTVVKIEALDVRQGYISDIFYAYNALLPDILM